MVRRRPSKLDAQAGIVDEVDATAESAARVHGHAEIEYSVSAEATARSTGGLLLPPCAVHTDEGAAAMGADKRTSHMPAAGAALGGRPWGRHAMCVATRTPAGWRRDIRELSQSGAQQLSLSDPQCSGSMAQRAERRDSVREGRRLR